MNAIHLLEDLGCLGVEVETDGVNIHFQGTKEPLTPEMIEALKRNKQEIIKVLISHGQGLHRELEYEAVHREIINAGLTSKWQNYLLEGVEILVDHEGYSEEEAQEEVIKMIPYYGN